MGRRRELMDAIGRAAGPLFFGTPDEQAFRRAFSRMRAMTAAHQASGPAVLLGEQPEKFRASAGPMRAANREFICWMRAAIARLGR